MSVEVDPQAFDSSGRYIMGYPPPFGLFPPKSYFKAVCSCPECYASVLKLKKFEEDIGFKHMRVMGWFSHRCDVEKHIFDLFRAMQGLRFLLDLLHYDLKGLGFPPQDNDSKLKKADLEISRMMIATRLLHGRDHDADPKKEFTKNVSNEIKRVLDSYGSVMNTKVKVELIDILKIEDQHENHKKSAAENGGKLNPSISSSYIIQQIELLEKLSVEELCSEVEELLHKFVFLTMNLFECSKADEEISAICRTMATISHPFWHTYLKNGKCLAGHDSTGLKDTLINLCEKVDLFESLWQEKYALLFPTLDEGSSPKKSEEIWEEIFFLTPDEEGSSSIMERKRKLGE